MSTIADTTVPIGNAASGSQSKGSREESVEGTIAEAARRLVVEFDPEQVWLFGSHAWGVPREDSDLDLMVIVSQSSETPIRRMQRAHRCLAGLNVATDVLVETREKIDRYKHLRSTLSHKILNEGRLIYG